MDRVPPPLPPLLPPPLPPHERTAAHSGMTLYTPESLRQWRLERQHMKQQLTAASQDRSRNTSSEVAACADVASDLSRSTTPTLTEKYVESPRLRTPTHRHAPYARMQTYSIQHLRPHTDVGHNMAFDPTRELPVCLTSPQTSVSNLWARRFDQSLAAAAVAVEETHGHQQYGRVAETGRSRTETKPRNRPRLTSPHRSPSASATLLETAPILAGTAPLRATCRVGWCTQPPKRHGLCWTHGGEKKCCSVDCGSAATDGEFCELHHQQLQGH